jgi:hypothetical protein
MKKMLQSTRSFLKAHARHFSALCLTGLFALAYSGTAFGQEAPVTGKVTTAAGVPLPGVTVRVQGTRTVITGWSLRPTQC